MADNNLQIAELGQRAAQNFFSSFDQNARTLFNASMQADQAKLNAANSMATFALNKVNTESAMRSREAQIFNLNQENQRAQEIHNLKFSEENIKEEKRLRDLKIKNEELKYDTAKKKFYDEQANEFFSLGTGTILDDMNRTYEDKYDRRFVMESQELFRSVKARMGNGTITPEQAVRIVRSEYPKIKSRISPMTKDKWRRSDKSFIARFNEPLAERMSQMYDEEMASERNAIASSFVLGSIDPAGAAAYKQYISKNPHVNVAAISEYQKEYVDLEASKKVYQENIAHLNGMIEKDPGEPYYTEFKEKRDSYMSAYFLAQERQSDIGTLIRNGQPYMPMQAPGDSTDPKPKLTGKAKEIYDQTFSEAANNDSSFAAQNAPLEKNEAIRQRQSTGVTSALEALNYDEDGGPFNISNFLDRSQLDSISTHHLDRSGRSFLWLINRGEGRLDEEALNYYDDIANEAALAMVKNKGAAAAFIRQHKDSDDLKSVMDVGKDGKVKRVLVNTPRGGELIGRGGILSDPMIARGIAEVIKKKIIRETK